MSSTDTPLPYKLKNNLKDRRGYPIPYIVYRDRDGTPHFTINDQERVFTVLLEKRCALCGKPHRFADMWFIGGPSAAFHEHGAFVDPPVHRECGLYALNVCPFIAAPNYSKRIDVKTLDPSKVDLGATAFVIQNDMPPDRPPYFVFARTSSYQVIEPDPGQIILRPRRPWKHIEFWCQGREITQAQAKELSARTDHPVEELAWWPK